MKYSIFETRKYFEKITMPEFVDDLKKECIDKHGGEIDYIYPLALEEKEGPQWEMFLEGLKLFLEYGEKPMSKKSRFLIPIVEYPDLEMFEALKSTPRGAFYEVEKFYYKDWLENRLFRSNVNLEGFAYWNAALFAYKAKMERLSLGAIGLVLRIVPFNESKVQTAFFCGDPKKEIVTSVLPEIENKLWNIFIKELKDVFKSYHQKNADRLAAIPIKGGRCKEKEQWIISKIKGIYEKCRRIEAEALREHGFVTTR